MSKYFNLKYRCRICLALYEFKEEAAGCCDNVQLIYECYDCGIQHTSLEAVKECCQTPPSSSEILRHFPINFADDPSSD